MVNGLDSNYHKGADGKRTMIADYRNDEGLRIRKNGISTCLPTRRHSETDISTMPPLVVKSELKRLDDVQLIAKKRVHDTPKEINIYLKEHKIGTNKEIAVKLDLPKTQVDHYFRTDKYRAIPCPEVWLKLKKLLKFDDTYDKQVTEIYEKEYEFESSKRVYDSEGISQTINTGNSGLYKIKEATKKGYAEADIGDSINFSVPSSKTRRGRVGKGVAQTLDTASNQATISLNKNQLEKLNKLKVDSSASGTLTEAIGRGGSSREYLSMLKKNEQLTGQIRRLTPTECERLQGFPDGWTEGQSDTQRYKQMGNAITVDVAEAIFRKLYKEIT